MRSKRKSLIAGIVLTGGGSQLKHLSNWLSISQEWIHGLVIRMSIWQVIVMRKLPVHYYATAVGLVMDGLKRHERKKLKCIEEELIAEQAATSSEQEINERLEEHKKKDGPF
jgi:cell division protein FtsA